MDPEIRESLTHLVKVLKSKKELDQELFSDGKAYGCEGLDFASESAIVDHSKPWADHIETVVFTKEQIESRVKELAQKISKDYAGKELVLVGILTGAISFLSDLMRHLTIPHVVDFMSLSSYGSEMQSSGVIKVKKDMNCDPSGKHILIVEDLIDTGNTLVWLKAYLKSKKCASARVCAFLDKKVNRDSEDRTAEYIGYSCPNKFVVGYGMDFDEKYRGLDFVGILKPEVYS